MSSMTVAHHFKKKKCKRGRTAMMGQSDAPAMDLALAALNVSEKKDMSDYASLAPTPMGSPMHQRAKKARFAIDGDDLDDLLFPDEPATSALLIVSSRLEKELARRLVQKKERQKQSSLAVHKQQLGYFAIATAFQRAFRERNPTVQPLALE
ncbi:hypothetical protein SPRG_19968 [Saprolegnia parasitica CBS 223.65]|uniref:Uncharacterized protein n=1 Tax=Saprolegnia parasitica (strain CBS 223.65) TaxID=695850 RepID=A0A067CE54_SAPPC|nr:hypothetical protein SPRG_19968 [Saprolegnia parasitica CBS 223.65]KDO28753.1 hypothetical protein SPRG_19968 [Saprolegnia parasitica CBS 223.65]|eukprot:XP_012200500.1 hypothetical protein SPRG_19968 [Saprolegnia parasitica CBS 223.65]